MTDEEIKRIVLEKLVEVAPDVNPESLEPHAAFRDQFDFDSMDCLNFAIGLHEALGIEIPETDYPKIGSLDGCIAYLQARQSASPPVS